jgi:hypothetical protein
MKGRRCDAPHRIGEHLEHLVHEHRFAGTSREMRAGLMVG